MLFVVRLLAALTSAVLLVPPATAQSEPLANRIVRFDQSFPSAHRLSGTLLVASADSIVFRHTFGASDAISGSHLTASTPIPVASITKTFTLIALTQLIVERRLGLDDTVGTWIPNFPDGGRITVRHLLNHRAGIPHRVTDLLDEQRVQTASSIVELATRAPRAFAPGVQSSYSTAGFAVLARILEVVEQAPFHDVMRARVFAPAGMQTSFDLTDTLAAHQAHAAFVPHEDALVPVPRRHLSYLVGGGSSASTADDLLRFVRAVRGGTYRGVRFENLAPQGAVTWTGASGGYFSSVSVRSDGVVSIWVGNTWGAAASALVEALPALLRGESPSPPAIPKAVSGPAPRILADFEGRYQTRPGAFITVQMNDGLRLDDNYLVPTGLDTFWAPGNRAFYTFVRNDAGAISAVDQRANLDLAATRLPRIP